MFNDPVYEKLHKYFASKKDEQYELISTSSSKKECVIHAAIPEVPPFTYGVAVNRSEHITNDHIVIWDVFNTGQFYVSEKVFDQIGYFRGIFPMFYIYNLGINTSEIFNPDSNNSSESNPSAQNVGQSTLLYYRCDDQNYNGWAFSWYNVLGVKQIIEETPEQPELPFEFTTETTLTEVINDITSNLEKSNKKISQMISKTKISKQAKTMLKQIQEMEAAQNVVAPICSKYTCVSQSASINIISKEYSFANTPEGFSYCSHANAPKAFNGTVSICPYSPSHQAACSMYTPESKIIERRNSLDHSGNLLYDFEVTLSTLNNLNDVVVIKNMINNEVVNTITYPANTTSQEAISQSLHILDDLISSWNDLPQTDTNVSVPEPEAKPEKKSYILSLA
jgi:hypothetical protein